MCYIFLWYCWSHESYESLLWETEACICTVILCATSNHSPRSYFQSTVTAATVQPGYSEMVPILHISLLLSESISKHQHTHNKLSFGNTVTKSIRALKMTDLIWASLGCPPTALPLLGSVQWEFVEGGMDLTLKVMGHSCSVNYSVCFPLLQE